MSKYDDEFKNVKKGLPEENTQQKASINFVLLFTIVGVVFALIIFLFQDTIFSQGGKLNQTGSKIPEQVIINGVFALLVGGVQAWIFKARIKSRAHIFIIFSIVGGLIGGVIGGLLLNAGINDPIVIGMANGALAGGISSGGQNMVMKNKNQGTRWLVYSIVSWGIIFSIGWIIGWRPESGTEMAMATIFLLAASGISLAVFLNNTPQIEFS